MADRTEGLAALLKERFAKDIPMLEELLPDNGDEALRKYPYALTLADLRCIVAALDALAARGVRLGGVPSGVVLTNLRYNIERAEAAGDVTLEVGVVALRRLYDCLAGAVPAAPEPATERPGNQCPYRTPNGHDGFLRCAREAGHAPPHRDTYGYSAGEWWFPGTEGKPDVEGSGAAPGDAGERERLAELHRQRRENARFLSERQGCIVQAGAREEDTRLGHEIVLAEWEIAANAHAPNAHTLIEKGNELAALLRQPGAPRTEPLRERDLLWCKALLATLDPREAEKVTAWFNANRPDGGGSASEGGTSP